MDVSAKSCPFCNWWQADAPPAHVEAPPIEAAPPETRWNGKILGAVAFAALLIIAFVIGSLIHGFEPSEVKAAQQPKPAPVSTAPAESTPGANIALVPDNSPPAAPPEQSTTAAQPVVPMNGSMTSGSDVTAVPSGQYGTPPQAAVPPAQTQSVDPRSIIGNIYQENGPQTRAPRPQRRAPTARVAQTQPVPEYQPVPSLHAHGRARLALTVDTSGRVRDIDIIQPLAGDMGRLIGAVQSWRFKPATENGTPVTSRFTVDINVE